MNRVTIPLSAGQAAALTARDVRLVAASMRYKPHDGQRLAAGFDVCIEHQSGRGAAVTASAPTLLEALAKALESFDRYVRPELR